MEGRRGSPLHLPVALSRQLHLQAKAMDLRRVDSPSRRRTVSRRSNCAAPIYAHRSPPGSGPIRRTTGTIYPAPAGASQKRSAAKAVPEFSPPNSPEFSEFSINHGLHSDSISSEPRLDLRRATARGSQCASPQSSFLHQHEENRNQNQYMNRGCNHSANQRSGNRFHHVSTDTTRPEDRNQAGENSADGHQLWPEALDSALNGRLVNVGVCKWAA